MFVSVSCSIMTCMLMELLHHLAGERQAYPSCHAHHEPCSYSHRSGEASITDSCNVFSGADALTELAGTCFALFGCGPLP